MELISSFLQVVYFNFRPCLNFFHPSDFNRDFVDDEEIDEFEDILDQTDIINNIFGGGEGIIMMDNTNDTSEVDDDSDQEYINETGDDQEIAAGETNGESANVNDDDDDDDEDENEEEELGSTDTTITSDSDGDEEMIEGSAAGTSSTSSNRVERRVIDDYDPNDEDDEVVKKIITELKKPRQKPPNIDTEDYPTDLSFHPDQNILAVATVTGDVLIYRYSNEENKLLYTHEVHSKAVRDIEFSKDGRDLISASRDKSIVISDFETGKFKRMWEKAHDEPVYSLTVVDENLIASGDDDGTVKLWDSRIQGSEPVFSLKEVEDYITSITTNSQKRLLLCTSGDGMMTTFNIASKKMYVQSEPYEEELTCAGVFRNESKVVAGSSKGNFYTFNWGEFGYHNDGFSGPSTPISMMIPITERIAITAGEEGVIRAMHLFPGRILGVVGQHSLAVETMDISNDGELIATSSHDNDIRFWNIKYFEDFDGIQYNAKTNKGAVTNNLPSSLRKNRAEFFSDLA